MMRKILFLLGLCAFLPARADDPVVPNPITVIWLTHSESDAKSVTICWQSKAPGSSEVFYRFSETAQEQRVQRDESVTLHQLPIPIPAGVGDRCFYRVQTGNEKSAGHSFKLYPSFQNPSDELRIAVMANRGPTKNKLGPDVLKQLEALDPHILATCGDNIPRLWNAKQKFMAARDNLGPFFALIRQHPKLFASTIFLPVPGNHDRELMNRNTVPRRKLEPGETLGEQAFYDTDATAFCRFFPLPGSRWKWHCDLPGNLRLIGLDLNHRGDYDTNYRTCHPFDPESEQFLWFKKTVAEHPTGFIVTLNNENDLAKELKHFRPIFANCSVILSGFGYYSSRNVYGQTQMLNTSIANGVNWNKTVEKFPFREQIRSFILLKLTSKLLTVEIRDLNSGEVADKVTISPR